MIAIRAVTFNGNGSVVVEFVNDERDVKSNGLLLNHVAFCPAEEYEDEIDAVLSTAMRLVESITIDSDRLGPPERPPALEDDDDDE